VKVSHYVYVALTITATTLASLVGQFQAAGITLPAWALPAVTALGGIVGLFTDAAPVAAKLRRAFLRTPGAGVFLMTACATAFGVSLGGVLGACGAGGLATTDITAGLETTLCVIRTYSIDIEAGMNDPAAIADAAVRCISAEVSGNDPTKAQSMAGQIIAEHRAAEERELLRMTDGGPTQ
jgi:hypothetical protein